MKKTTLFSVLLLLAVTLFAISCGGGKKDKLSEAGPASFIEVKIGGMSCTGCEQTIQKNVGKLEGVKSVKATFTDGKAIVEYFPSLVDTANIRTAITGSGYSVQGFSPVSQ
jgi:copper chaperone CopZ